MYENHMFCQKIFVVRKTTVKMMKLQMVVNRILKKSIVIFSWWGSNWSPPYHNLYSTYIDERGGQNRLPDKIFYENHENLQKIPPSVTKRVE